MRLRSMPHRCCKVGGECEKWGKFIIKWARWAREELGQWLEASGAGTSASMGCIAVSKAWEREIEI